MPALIAESSFTSSPPTGVLGSPAMGGENGGSGGTVIGSGLGEVMTTEQPKMTHHVLFTPDRVPNPETGRLELICDAGGDVFVAQLYGGVAVELGQPFPFQQAFAHPLFLTCSEHGLFLGVWQALATGQEEETDPTVTFYHSLTLLLIPLGNPEVAHPTRLLKALAPLAGTLKELLAQNPDAATDLVVRAILENSPLRE